MKLAGTTVGVLVSSWVTRSEAIASGELGVTVDQVAEGEREPYSAADEIRARQGSATESSTTRIGSFEGPSRQLEQWPWVRTFDAADEL